MKIQRTLQAAGVAALILFPFYISFISPGSSERLHSPFPFTKLAVSLLLNLVFVTLTTLGAFSLLNRIKVFSWLFALIPGLIIAWIARPLLQPPLMSLDDQFWISFVTIAFIVMLVLRCQFPRAYRISIKVSAATLVGLGFFCILVAVQLIRIALWNPGPATITRAAILSGQSVNQSRIVWILMDELSYDQVFGHRNKNLSLPNFDALGKSSTLFTDVQPAGKLTEKAVPSLFLGRIVDRVAYTQNNQYEVAFQGANLQPFNAAQTPFALAKKHGFNTGIAGWFNPYCSIFFQYADRCYWTRTSFYSYSAFPNGSLLTYMLEPWRRIVRRPTYAILGGKPFDDTTLGHRVPEYDMLLEQATTMLQQPEYNFTFLHLSVPHPPGFYNRESGEFDFSGQRSYLDNLALADKTLGQILPILETSSAWPHTYVIVCGDHSWRTWIWRYGPGWSTEDESSLAWRGV